MSVGSSAAQTELEQIVQQYYQSPDRARLERQLLGSLPLLRYLESLAAEGRLGTLLSATVGDRAARDTKTTEEMLKLIDHVINVATRPPAEETPAYPPAASSSYSFLEPPQQSGELGRLGGYRVLAELGQGGMGIVFRVEDLQLRRQVALKVMQPILAHGGKARERFLREARAVAKLENDHIVAIHQVGEAGGMPFLVMPLLTGESLEARLRRDKQLPVADVIRLGRQMAEGLAAAHAAGIIHRDIKPPNVWLYQRPAADGGPAPAATVKLLDFGLARSTAGESVLSSTGGTVGTPGYMSPEQVEDQPTDHRSDLFSLGAVLYRAATGQPAFRATTMTGLLWAVLRDTPPAPARVRLGVPAALSELIVQLLAKQADKRPASATEVVRRLRVLEGDFTEAGPVVRQDEEVHRSVESQTAVLQSGPPDRSWSRRAVVTRLAAIAGGAAALGGVGFVVYQLTRPAPLPPLTGYVDVLLSDPDKDRTRRQNVRLSDAGALPIKAGDKFCIVAELNRPAYLYVFWVRADGEVEPAYPWKPGDWASRPPAEQPISNLRIPPEPDQFFKMPEGTRGMETLVLLAGDAALPADVDVRAELGIIPPQKEQSLRAAVWFRNGFVVKDEPDRGVFDFVETADDPLLQLQQRIQTRLGKWFSYTRSVSFAYQGK
jgi:serine/threonine protein kinase